MTAQRSHLATAGLWVLMPICRIIPRSSASDIFHEFPFMIDSNLAGLYPQMNHYILRSTELYACGPATGNGLPLFKSRVLEILSISQACGTDMALNDPEGPVRPRKRRLSWRVERTRFGHPAVQNIDLKPPQQSLRMMTALLVCMRSVPATLLAAQTDLTIII